MQKAARPVANGDVEHGDQLLCRNLMTEHLLPMAALSRFENPIRPMHFES